jgi:DNA repair photolyase
MSKRPLPARGTGMDPVNRFTSREIVLDGDERDHELNEGEGTPARTRVFRDTSRSVISRNTSPDIPFDVSLNPYRGCEHGCSYCVSADTPILMADRAQKPIADLEIGDRIIGTSKHGRDRRLVETTVVDHWQSRRRAYRVTLATGSSVVASGDHRFLTSRGWKHVTGSTRGACRRPHLTAGDAVLSLATSSSGGMRLERVDRVESLGVELPMFDITTGTGDFIANGMVSHNCYARPTHEYLGLSAGLDFERMLFAKLDAAQLLAQELAKPSWVPKHLALSGVTDPYQPIERRLRVTRGCLEVLAAHRQPVGVITKNALVTRDLDLLGELARYGAARVMVSITTLDEDLRRRLEPRTSTIAERLRAVRVLAEAGVSVGVNVAPVIPGLNDHEIPDLLEAARDAGAQGAAWTLLRLPHAVEDVFVSWLREQAPLRAERVLARLR